MGEATQQARQQVAAAREAVAAEVDRLGASACASLDLPARMRRDPVRTTAVGAGLLFLLVGGPKRTLRRAGRLFGRGEAPPRSLLPQEVERIVSGFGEREGDVRAALERGFADYLESKEGKRVKASRRQSLWRLFDTVTGPLASRASRQLADRLFSPGPSETETSGRGIGRGAGPASPTPPTARRAGK